MMLVETLTDVKIIDPPDQFGYRSLLPSRNHGKHRRFLVIGQIGSHPGNEWEHDLLRKGFVLR